MSNWRHHSALIGEIVPENRPFRDPFWRGIRYLAPLRGKSHTKTINRWITNIVLFIHAKAWLRHCSQRCHLRTAARQGWVCLSDIPCSSCPHSWSAAGSPNLCTNLKIGLHQLNNICSSYSKFRFHRYRIGDTRWQELAEKYPTMARFGTHFGGACGILLRAEANYTHKPYIDSKYCLVCTCQGIDCSQRCHLRTAAWHGWVCLSDLPCSRCPLSWSAAGSPNLYRNVKLWVAKLNNICRSHS